MKLKGQVAIVTGAGRGIGRAVALAFSREGARVALASRTTAALNEVAALIRSQNGLALVAPTDVSQEPSVAALVERTLAEWGQVDILLTAAGVAAFGPVGDSKLSEWDQMMAVNLRGVYLTCRAVLAPMMARRQGTIINVVSAAAKRPIPGCAAYAASKHGVLGFSRVLAEELRAHGIRVGALVPGAVDTPLWDQIPDAPDRTRMLRPQDVAEAAVLMASLPAGASLEELTLLPAGGIL
ncbi:MAG: SDR family NAD(P)-dependent oxidoreductase [Candidatus Rokubacteria bacterium]|nr:SDR family NAD(P)-dependent oxidoreductase [Candidatus Rokubacteria bacterium]